MFIYLTKDWLSINKKWWKFIIYDPNQESTREIPTSLVEWMVLFGRIQLTTDVIRECLRGKVPVFFLSKTWSYFGKLDSLEIKNVEVLYNHIKASLDEKICLNYSKAIISAKIHNSKIMLQRRNRFYFDFSVWQPEILENLNNYIKKVEQADNIDTLRWLEWWAAREYYKWFWNCVTKPFIFDWRNKRPPLDPINCMLSLWYTLLAQTIQMVLDIQWLNSQIWFFHQPKDIRSLLVLDIMEMYRARIVDDLVVRLAKSEKMKTSHFLYDIENEKRPVFMTDEWLHIFIWEYYKTVFKEKDEQSFENQFVKLKIIEKEIEKFKQTLVKELWYYEGFKIK